MHAGNQPHIEAHGLTETGAVRPDNQDAIRVSPAAFELTARFGHLYAVADGMGGLNHGGIASTLALELLFQSFYSGGGETPLARLRRGAQAANLGIHQAAHRMGAGRMGTTLTAVHVDGHALNVLHVGDSRAYLIRNGEARCLTNDHTRVGELVRMRLLAPDKVRGHAQRSVLDKCLGMDLFMQPDLFSVAVRPGDRIVLCTDGVWGHIEDREFAEFADAEPDLERFNQALAAEAIRRGSDDNVSLLTLRLLALAGAPEQIRSASALAAFLAKVLRR
jgi:protein phosphatase